MARLKSEFQHQYRKAHGTPLREKLLSQMAAVSQWGSRLAPIANWLTGQSPIRWLNEQILGLDSRRPLPHFSKQSFISQWEAVKPASGRPQVALFADTFNNFYEPDNLHAAARLIQATGHDIVVIPRVCCGRPLISKGFLEEATRQAVATTKALTPYVEMGIPILFSEPSCHSAIIDDHLLLLRGEQQIASRKVAAAAKLVDQWIGENGADLNFRPGPRRLLVHGHCHQKALVGMEPMLKMLQLLPESEISPLDSGCCGLAGLFGYEQYEVSRAIGERRLFPAVRGMDGAERIVAPGFSCRHQVDHFTEVMPQSPVKLMAELLID